MPNIDEAAKAWQVELAGRVGKAVQDRRKALGFTAQQLAQRTAEFGYPISRVAISKIESNTRAGKIDLGELIALAAALCTSPTVLVFPGPYQGSVEILPEQPWPEFIAVQWFSGISYAKFGRGSVDEYIRDIDKWIDATRTLRDFRKLDALKESRVRAERDYINRGDYDGAREVGMSFDEAIHDLERELGVTGDG